MAALIISSIFLTLLIITSVSAQPDSSTKNIYVVPDGEVNFGLHLTNRGDSVFTLERIMMVSAPSGVPPGDGISINDSIEETAEHYLYYDSKILTADPVCR